MRTWRLCGERQGRFEEALSSAQRAIELKPDYSDGYNNLGTILRSMHRLDNALWALQKAVELNPTFALAEFNLGATHLLAEITRVAQNWLPAMMRCARGPSRRPSTRICPNGMGDQYPANACWCLRTRDSATRSNLRDFWPVAGVNRTLNRFLLSGSAHRAFRRMDGGR